MSLNRSAGFSLIELLSALVLTGLLGLVLTRAVVSIERAARAELAENALQLAFDTGLGFLAAELAEAGRGIDGNDLLRLGPDSLSYRAVRGQAVACRVDATSITLSPERLQLLRIPQAGRDSLLLFTGVDSRDSASDGWVSLPILSVGNSNCSGLSALHLLTLLDTTQHPLPLLPAFPPVRLFEVMQARIYPSLGAWWLGARSESGGEVIQPLAGPFISAGASFAYLDSLQAPTLSPSAVARIEVHLNGRRPGWPAIPGFRTDSAGLTLSPSNLLP